MTSPFKLPRAPRLIGPRDVEVWLDAPSELTPEHDGLIVGFVVSEEPQNWGLASTTGPAAIVLRGHGRKIKKILLSADTSPLYVHDAIVTNEGVSQAAIEGVESGWTTWANDPEPLEPYGEPYDRATVFYDCVFEADERYRKVYPPAGVRIPGITGDKVGPKWWVHAQCDRGWWFERCRFTAAYEHHVYGPWMRWLRVVNCYFGASGGTNIQSVWRYGKPSSHDPRWYGNPSYIPPPTVESVVADCTFEDYDILPGREASAVTFANTGDVHLKNLRFSGSRGAIAVWCNQDKGAFIRPKNEMAGHAVLITDADFIDGQDMGTDSPIVDQDYVLIDARGRVSLREDARRQLGDYHAFGKVVLDNIDVAWSEHHNRVQVMVSGAEEIYARNVKVDSFKKHVAFGTEGGGPFRNGKIRMSGEWPEMPWTWTGERYVRLPEANGISYRG